MDDVSIKHIEVHECSSCGGDHKDLLAVKMDKPVVIDAVEYSHVMVCPETGLTVYVLFL